VLGLYGRLCGVVSFYCAVLWVLNDGDDDNVDDKYYYMHHHRDEAFFVKLILVFD